MSETAVLFGDEHPAAALGEVRFTAYGLPQPKGSARAFVPKGWSRPVITSTNRNLKTWEHVVASAAQAVAGDVFFNEAVSIGMRFYLPRPKSLPKRVRYAAKKPDLSKLIRSTEDALTGVLWRDDAQVVAILATKTYTTEAPRVDVTVRPATANDLR